MSSPSHDEIIECLAHDGGLDGVELSDFKFGRLGADTEYFFRNCTLKNTRIKDVALRASHWQDCDFVNCEFVSCNLREAVFENCQFFSIDTVEGGAFRFCNLESACFKSCDLSLSKLLGCDAYDVEFADCKMVGFRVENTGFAREFGLIKRNSATFSGCNMADAGLNKTDFSTCVFKDCDLSDVDLSHAALRSSEMTQCNLHGAELRACSLSGSDLRGSVLDGFDLNIIKDYRGMQISAGQQHVLLNSIGIDVFPEEG